LVKNSYLFIHNNVAAIVEQGDKPISLALIPIHTSSH